MARTGRPTLGDKIPRSRNSSVYIGGPRGLNDIVDLPVSRAGTKRKKKHTAQSTVWEAVFFDGPGSSLDNALRNTMDCFAHLLVSCFVRITSVKVLKLDRFSVTAARWIDGTTQLVKLVMKKAYNSYMNIDECEVSGSWKKIWMGVQAPSRVTTPRDGPAGGFFLRADSCSCTGGLY